MNLYISDLHFGHKNVILFEHRPFSDVDTMDHCLIQLWNSRVSADDDVYIVGDFCYRSGRTPDWYLRQLKGHKHLIIGNHDKATLDCENAAKYLESVEKMQHVTAEDKQICLCHYPLAEWYKSRHGSWLIYGHIHGARDEVYEFMKTRERALNAGACINRSMNWCGTIKHFRKRIHKIVERRIYNGKNREYQCISGHNEPVQKQ